MLGVQQLLVEPQESNPTAEPLRNTLTVPTASFGGPRWHRGRLWSSVGGGGDRSGMAAAEECQESPPPCKRLTLGRPASLLSPSADRPPFIALMGGYPLPPLPKDHPRPSPFHLLHLPALPVTFAWSVLHLLFPRGTRVALFTLILPPTAPSRQTEPGLIALHTSQWLSNVNNLKEGQRAFAVVSPHTSPLQHK